MLSQNRYIPYYSRLQVFKNKLGGPGPPAPIDGTPMTASL